MQRLIGTLLGKRKPSPETRGDINPDQSRKRTPSSLLATSATGGIVTAATSGVARLPCVMVADPTQGAGALGVSSEKASTETEPAACAGGNATTSGDQTKGDAFSLSGFEENLNEENTNKGTNTLFTETLGLYDEYQLHKLTKFYQDRLEPAIEEGVEDISSWLTQKECFSQQEHRTLTELTRTGQRRQSAKRLLHLVMGKGSRARTAMWESFVKMRSVLPKLNKIMTEIQRQGASLVNDLTVVKRVADVPIDLKAVQQLHREKLLKQNERLEVNTILVEEKVKRFQLVDRYTELTVISDLRHRELVEHELLARGRDHEEWRQKQLRGELEKIRTDNLFHSSFSRAGGGLFSWVKRFISGGDPSPRPTGTSAVVSGVAGIGKTTLVQKIVHDWAKGKIYPHFHFVFVFKFRDLNALDCRINLSRLIVDQYPYLEEVLDELWKHPEMLLFIFDGLDEFRGKIDFADQARDTEPQRKCTDPGFCCKVSDIVYSLIQKKLLPGCSVLVTSRPTALQLLAKAQVSVWAEILGFVGEERKQYFHKFFDDQEVAAAVYRHVEENQLLFTMCYNPSYCWILALSLGPFFVRKHSHKHHVPKTITQLFSHFIYHILKHHSVKMRSHRDVMLKIGEMAFAGVCQRKIVFSNEDLIKSNLQPSQFLSGFLMELVESERSEHSVVYTFPHLTVQEFVAALAQFLPPNPEVIRKCFDEADKEGDGRFEIFLRFVAGLSSPQAQPLEEFLGPFERQTTCEVIAWLKEKVKTQIAGTGTDTVDGKRKLLNSLHYLFESQNPALAQLTLGSVQTLTLGGSSSEKGLRLTPIDCIVVSQAIGLCDTIKQLDLTSCYIQDEGLQHLVPVLHKCQELQLRGNNLGDSGVQRLCESLRNPECKIQTLELGNNNLGDSGVKPLCEDLRNPECKIQRLWLGCNNLTADCAEDLASALSTSRSLTELFLHDNRLGDSGVKRLCEALRNSKCKIQTLWLDRNTLTDGCADDLASALSTSCSLTELFLNDNRLGDSGVKRLCEALRNSKCKIQTLWLNSNSLTDGCADDLSSAVSTRRSLKELHLGQNSFTDGSVPALRRLILTCTSLEEIWLDGNQFSSDGENQLMPLQDFRAGLKVTVRQ